MSSQTLLPMPSGMELIYQAQQQFNCSKGEEIDLDIKSSIEGIVIKWSSICSDVLKETSEIAFAEGQHPTPFREVEFWNARLTNLENIYDQLRDPRVKKMMLYLECTNSTYLHSFKTLFKNIVAAVVEARNICLYMKPMKKHFARFEDNDLLDNEEYIGPLVHCCGLLWANSRYYCNSTKIVTLFRMIGNLLIEAATKQLDPSSIFQGEADDVFKKFEKAIHILKLFKSSFEIVRSNIHTYFENEEDVRPWTFHPRSVFQRLMDFIDRLTLVRNILETELEFTKLEKVEIGGLRGRGLSTKCNEVFEEFNVIYNVFRNIQYEVLDPGDKNIENDYEAFTKKCLELDRRLAAIFSQAFDDCYNLESIFKLINVIGKLIERQLIRDEVTVKYPVIIELFHKELDTVKVLFDEFTQENAPLDSYCAPISGYLMWLYKLKERIGKPGKDFQLLEHPISKSEEALYVFKKREQMLNLIEDMENRVFNNWLTEIPMIINTHIVKTVFVRLPDKLLKLNFHPELEAILREISYLKKMGYEMTAEINQFYERNEELLDQRMAAKRIIEYYNHLRTYTLKEEFDLIQGEMDAIDELLNKLISDLDWMENSTLLEFADLFLLFIFCF